MIENIPVIEQMGRKIEGMPDFKLMQGYSAETSGGILTMISKSKAQDFINEAKDKFGQTVWMVGKVVKGSKKAIIAEDCSVTDIQTSFLK